MFEMRRFVNGVLLVYLLFASYRDLKSRTVSVKTAACFAVFAVLSHLIYPQTGHLLWLAGIIPGMFLLLAAYASRGAVGYGDALAMMVCGLYLGFYDSVNLLLTGLLLTCPVSLFLLICKKANRKLALPFVPFLLAAYLLCSICGR